MQDGASSLWCTCRSHFRWLLHVFFFINTHPSLLHFSHFFNFSSHILSYSLLLSFFSYHDISIHPYQRWIRCFLGLKTSNENEILAHIYHGQTEKRVDALVRGRNRSW